MQGQRQNKMLILAIGLCLIFNISCNNKGNPNSQITEKEPVKIEIAIAIMDLPPKTVINKNHFKIDTMKKDLFDKGVKVSAEKVVGRILVVPVIKKQVLTESCFAPEEKMAYK